MSECVVRTKERSISELLFQLQCVCWCWFRMRRQRSIHIVRRSPRPDRKPINIVHFVRISFQAVCGSVLCFVEYVIGNACTLSVCSTRSLLFLWIISFEMFYSKTVLEYFMCLCKCTWDRYLLVWHNIFFRHSLGLKRLFDQSKSNRPSHSLYLNATTTTPTTPLHAMFIEIIITLNISTSRIPPRESLTMSTTTTILMVWVCSGGCDVRDVSL